MKKLDIVNEMIDCGKLSNCDLLVLCSVYKRPYITCLEIAKDVDINPIAAFTSINNLIKVEPALVELDQKNVITTDYADDLIRICADTWAVHKGIQAPGTKKRDVTDDMDSLKGFVELEYPKMFSKTAISRQNYIIDFSNKKIGFKTLEIRNDGNVRISVSKKKLDIIDVLSKIEGVKIYPPSETSYITSFELSGSKDSINTLLSVVKTFSI